jgi:hypothetical protein
MSQPGPGWLVKPLQKRYSLPLDPALPGRAHQPAGAGRLAGRKWRPLGRSYIDRVGEPAAEKDH